MKESYGTLSETLNGLKQAGYLLDFNTKEDCIVCHHTNTILSPDDFEIDKVFRFEGESNPADEAIVYAISSRTFNVKGILVNGYGISSDEVSAALVEKLNSNNR
jgi:hypothetical protein